jgi:hypothetical protein
LFCASDDVQANYTTNYDLTKLQDGQMYLVLQDYRIILVPKEMKVHLDNLFNGNKLLGKRRWPLVPNVAAGRRAHTDDILSISGDIMNDFINENWREILREVGEPAVKALGGLFFKIFRDASNTVPYKEAFDDAE